MGKMIEIPIFGGLNTQYDSEDIPLEACVATTNFELDKPGLIYKRDPTNLEATKTSRSFTQIAKWVDPASGNSYWLVYCKQQDKIYRYDSDWSNEEDTKTLADVSDIKILNFGSRLRFANGLDKKPGIYQYIDRNYFWNSAIKTFTDHDYDDTAPDNDDASMVLSIAEETTSGGTLDNANTYYYKFVPVFDGNQEAPLTANYISNQPASAGDDTTHIITATFSDVNTAWNERLTAYKVYRSTAYGGPYYHIATVSTLDTTDSNLNYQSGAICGYGLYDPNKSWTEDEHENNYLVTNRESIQIDGNYSNILEFDSALSETHSSTWNGYYSIFSAPPEIVGFEGVWTVNFGTADLENTEQVHSGPHSWRITAYGGSNPSVTATVTVNENTVYKARVWVYLNSAMTVRLKLDGVIKESTAITGEWVQLTGEVTTGAGDTDIVVRIDTASCSPPEYFWMWDFTCARNGTLEEEGTAGYYGLNTVIDRQLSLDREDIHTDWRVMVGGDTFGNADSTLVIKTVANNVERAIKVDSDFAGNSLGATQKLYLCKNYTWQSTANANEVELKFYDTNLLEGSRHPLGETNIEVNYKYAAYVGSRLYVGNVMLDPDSEAEEHKDWIMFSESTQPDVIPIVNYIQVKDLQGGEITGLAEMFGDLVVFMERGIYRLSVPSDDPSSWSLVEANENVGCIAPNSIEMVEGAVFFAGYDYLYMLTQNFEIFPVTLTIRDDYQGYANLENTRTLYDTKKKRLLCRFGDEQNSIYALDLMAARNGQEVWNTLNTTDVEFFTIDEDLDIYFASLFMETPPERTYIFKLTDSSGDESAFRATRKSGWIPVSDLGRTKILRRLNARYTSPDDDITVKIYTDGNGDSQVWSGTLPSGSKYDSLRIGQRARFFQIELLTQSSTNYNVEIDKLEIEVDK